VALVDLPIGYYRDNFLLLLDHGDSLYGDLLGDEEKAFSAAFRGSSLAAQRLYVRLISRKGPVFRSDRVRYKEIGSVADAAAELEAAGLLGIDHPGDLRAAVTLLRRDELLEALASEGGGRAAQSLLLPELIESFLSSLPPERALMRLQRRFRVFEPLGLHAVSTYRLLFFGNLWQDLTEFVLSDLGLVRYEAYRIAPEDRLFSSAVSLQNALLLHELASRCREAAEAGDTVVLRAIVDRLPAEDAEDTAGGLRGDILATVARHLERAGDAAGALAIYRQTEAPPARERQARIMARLGKPEDALAICRRILGGPTDEEELQFAARFAPRLERRLYGRAAHPQPPARPRADVLRLSWSEGTAVEEAVREHYRELRWEGYHTENALWNGLFGLAFWDIIFMPVRGAFHNRFQRGPRDLFTPRFRSLRSEAIERRLAEIRDSDHRIQELRATYDRCLGTANALVAWDRVPLAALQTALARIPREHLALVFDLMAENLGVHRAGFPDLILFPPAETADVGAGYELVEVKGPGDQLRPNQERWLRFFGEHGIPARVVRVERG
jgi:VRR-NUC domain